MLLHDSVVFIVHLLLSTGQDTAQAGKSLGAWVFRLSQCFSVCITASPWYCGSCDDTRGHAEALGSLMGYLTLLALMPSFLLTQLHSVSRLVFKEKLSNSFPKVFWLLTFTHVLSGPETFILFLLRLWFFFSTIRALGLTSSFDMSGISKTGSMSQFL